MRRFGLAPGVAWRRISDEIVALKLDTGEYYSITHAGVDVWEWLVQGADEVELGSRLSQSFQVTPKQAEKDLKSFISHCLNEKLIGPAKEKDKASAPFKAPSRKKTYARPSLRSHSTLDPKFYAMATY